MLKNYNLERTAHCNAKLFHSIFPIHCVKFYKICYFSVNTLTNIPKIYFSDFFMKWKFLIRSGVRWYTTCYFWALSLISKNSLNYFITENPGTRNEICVSLAYSGNENKISFTFPLYTKETQILFLVPAKI